LFYILSPDKKNLPEAHLAHYTSSTGYPLTDTEALDLVQKMHLNIFGSMPISKLARERYFTDNPGFESNIVTTEVLVDDDIIAVLKEGLYQEQRQ
jgi:hypothetical protein